MVKLAGRWLGVLLLLLLALATTTTAEEEPAYSCQQMSKVPKEERCQFVTTQCNPSGRIPVMELYYCSVEPAGFLAKIPFVVLLCLLLPLLFTLLGDTAEIYFSPNMSLVAQSIPKMRPRFAGVTFVAMGNGAADLSANVSAIRNGSVQLSAGAFTGAAMFVQCVVASEVIRISQGAPCRGATMRDVATFMVSLVGVALSFASGTAAWHASTTIRWRCCSTPSGLMALTACASKSLHRKAALTRWSHCWGEAPSSPRWRSSLCTTSTMTCASSNSQRSAARSASSAQRHRRGPVHHWPGLAAVHAALRLKYPCATVPLATALQ